MPDHGGDQMSPGSLGAYSALGKTFTEQVTASTVCLVGTELKNLTENLSLHCEILREKQSGHINFNYLVANINIWLHVEQFNHENHEM